MAQKTKLVKIQLPKKVTMGLFELMAITRQQILIEIYSNPLKIGTSGSWQQKIIF